MNNKKFLDFIWNVAKFFGIVFLIFTFLGALGECRGRSTGCGGPADFGGCGGGGMF